MSKPFKAFLLDTLLLFLFVLPIFLWFSIIEEPLAKHINWNLKISDNLNSIISLGLISGYYIIILGYLLSKDALNSSFGKRKYQLKIKIIYIK